MLLEITKNENKLTLDIDNIAFTDLIGKVSKFFSEYEVHNYKDMIVVYNKTKESLIDFTCYHIKLENKLHNMVLNMDAFRDSKLELSLILDNKRVNLYSLYSLMKLGNNFNIEYTENWDIGIKGENSLYFDSTNILDLLSLVLLDKHVE